MSFASGLYHARKKSGLSQENVAEKLGVSRQTISKWETGETLPDIRQSKRLAVLYHITLDELVEYDFDEEFFAYLDSMHIPRTATGDYSQSPVPWCGNDMVTNEASIAEGLMDVASNDVELLTGQKPMTARQLAKNYSYIWENHVTNWKDIR